MKTLFAVVAVMAVVGLGAVGTYDYASHGNVGLLPSAWTSRCACDGHSSPASTSQDLSSAPSSGSEADNECCTDGCPACAAGAKKACCEEAEPATSTPEK
jgi:hypothetical protein